MFLRLFFSSRRRHTRCALVTGVQTCALPIYTVTGEASFEPTDGGFVAIGHSPSTELFKVKLPLDADGYLEVTPGTSLTALPVVFAPGAVTGKFYRQAVPAAGTGCMPALDAQRVLAEAEYQPTVSAGRGTGKGWIHSPITRSPRPNPH